MPLTSFLSIQSSFRLVDSELLINNENSSAEGRRAWSDVSDAATGSTRGTDTTADSTLPPAPPVLPTVPPAPPADRTVPPAPALPQDPMPALDDGPDIASVLLSLAADPAVMPETALVPVPDLNENLVRFPEGEIAGENLDSDGESEIDPDAVLVGEDDEDHTLPDYVYEDATLQELMSDRYLVRRREVQVEKLDLLGCTTVAHGNTWTVRTDVLPEDVGIDPDADDFEDFVELGVRSRYLSEENIGFPQTARMNNDVRVGRRTSPRNKKNKERMQEAKVMFEMFLTLYPVAWRMALSRLNEAISYKNAKERLPSRHIKKITKGEYWRFNGMLLLCAVTNCGGIEGLYKNNKDGIVEGINGEVYMNKKRLKEIKSIWIQQFHAETQKDTNPWWKVARLVLGFNQNRQRTVAASCTKTFDESMSSFRPQKAKTGNLPNISYIQR